MREDQGRLLDIGEPIESACGLGRSDQLDIGGAPPARASMAVRGANAVRRPRGLDPSRARMPGHSPRVARQGDEWRIERRAEEEHGRNAIGPADVRAVVGLEERDLEPGREGEPEVNVTERDGRHEPTRPSIVQGPDLRHQPSWQHRGQAPGIDIEGHEREVAKRRRRVEPAEA